MKKVIINVSCFIFILGNASFLGAQDIPALAAFAKDDRVLILAPHPDDEAIACAGIIQEALSQGATVKIAYLTNGEHNQFAFIVYKKDIIIRKNEFISMGKIRRNESIKAMEFLGLDKKQLDFLGYPDFGTYKIFSDYWRSSRPFKSILTRIYKVPYKEDLSYGTTYVAENILRDLSRILVGFRPTKIFVSHPADINADHRALYLFLQIALADLRRQLKPPEIYPYLVHWRGWPLPRHYHPQLELAPPKQLAGGLIGWRQYKLSNEEIEKKHQAILYYRSQTASSAFYLLSFARKNELFGNLPEVNLYIKDTTSISFKDKFDSLRKKISCFFEEHNLSFYKEPKESDVNACQKGFDGVTYSLEDDFLRISIQKVNKGAKKRIVSKVYLFGYSFKKHFAEMPKIFIYSKSENFKIYNAGRRIEESDAHLTLSCDELILKVPLTLLGSPDFILASVRAYTGSLPQQYSGFQKINIIRRQK